MHPALLKLIVLSLKSGFRRAFRGARTVKGAFLILFTMGVLLLMIGPSVFAAVTMRGHPGVLQFSGWLEPYLPIMILGFCLLIIFGPAGEMAISFTPAEVDFLFPAPFHRRELLIYKLAKLFIGAVFAALFFSMTCLDLSQQSWLVGVRGHFPDAGLHATGRLVGGAGRADRGRTCLYAHAQADPARRGRARAGRAGPDALANSDSVAFRSWPGASGAHGPGGPCWRHSKSSAMRSWPTPFFPTWSAGVRRRPRSTWAC